MGCSSPLGNFYSNFNMDLNEFLSSTGDSTELLPRYKQAVSSHQKTKTLDLAKKSQKCRLRHSAKPSDSTSTLIDNVDISNSLNTHKLKLSMKSIYELDPLEKLKEIFSAKSSYNPKKVLKQRVKLAVTPHRRRHFKVDSIFEEKEADLIRNELSNIKSPQIWQQVVQNFKQSPTVLMDLIPLE